MSRVAHRSFSAGMDQLAAALAFVEAFCQEHACSGDEGRRLVLIVEELFTNTATHGLAAQPSPFDIEVQLELGFDGGQLTLEYVDNAPPFDPLAHVQRVQSDLEVDLALRPVGKLGLPVVLALAASADYAHEGGCNRLRLGLRCSG
jgi:anti-sigma regulatory factor (Ser/Thr protein kinase)